MQASKIKVGSWYAIKRNDELVRFAVTAVVTRRISNHNNPHDYESTVEGRIVDDASQSVVTVKSDSVLGPYDEHVELVERTKLERAEKELREEAVRQRNSKLRDLLYEKLGLDKTKFEHEHKQPVRTQWSNIEISGEAIPLLIDYLERR